MTLLLTIIMLLLFSALISGYETGLYVCDRLKARGRKRSRYFGAKTLVSLLEDRGRVVVSLLIANNICLFFASGCFTYVLVNFGLEDSINTALISAALFSPIVVVFAEMLPKDLFRLRSDPLLYHFSPIILVVHKLVRIVLALPIRLFSRRRMNASLMTRDEIEFHLTQYLRRGSLLASMATNILRIGEKRIKDVMIPISDCVTVTPETTLNEIISIAKKHRYSRLPVVESQDGKRVVGVVNIFDMFYRNAKAVKDVMRQVLRLGTAMALDDALLLMRVHRYPLAVVVNNTGTLLGIVTIKDIVEEITGEIRSW